MASFQSAVLSNAENERLNKYFSEYRSPPRRFSDSLTSLSRVNVSDFEIDDVGHEIAVERQPEDYDISLRLRNEAIQMKDIPNRYVDDEDCEDCSHFYDRAIALNSIMVRKLTRATGAQTYIAGHLYKDVINRDGLRFWELEQDKVPDVQKEGEEAVAPEYKWRLGSAGVTLPIFNGAVIKHSRQYKKSRKVASAPQDCDFYFDSNGEILKKSGERLSYHWHLFDQQNKITDWITAKADPAKLVLRHDGKIFDLDGHEQTIKWMYVHKNGSTLDPGFEDEPPQCMFVADGSPGIKLFSNKNGSLFVSSFGRPVLVADKELDVYGPEGHKVMIFNEQGEFEDRDRQPFEVDKEIYAPSGELILLVENLEEQFEKEGKEIPKTHYSGFNVKRDKAGGVIAGNPIKLDPNGPPVLYVKYCSRRKPDKITQNHPFKTPPFLEDKPHIPFWIVDPDGKVVVLHDKFGDLWDKNSKRIPPTGRKDEPNGDWYEYYLFKCNDKPCTENDVCFHDYPSDTAITPQYTTPERSQARQKFRFNQEWSKYLETSMNRSSKYYHTDDEKEEPSMKMFDIPQCIFDGSYQRYIDEMKKDPCAKPAKPKENKIPINPIAGKKVSNTQTDTWKISNPRTNTTPNNGSTFGPQSTLPQRHFPVSTAPPFLNTPKHPPRQSTFFNSMANILKVTTKMDF